MNTITSSDGTTIAFDKSGAAPYSPDREGRRPRRPRQRGRWHVYVYGISSGAALALDAAGRIWGISKVAVYDAPFVVDDSHATRPASYITELDGLIAADRRGDAIKMFMRRWACPAL